MTGAPSRRMEVMENLPNQDFASIPRLPRLPTLESRSRTSELPCCMLGTNLSPGKRVGLAAGHDLPHTDN